jgi:hypothetical protein
MGTRIKRWVTSKEQTLSQTEGKRSSSQNVTIFEKGGESVTCSFGGAEEVSIKRKVLRFMDTSLLFFVFTVSTIHTIPNIVPLYSAQQILILYLIF